MSEEVKPQGPIDELMRQVNEVLADDQGIELCRSCAQAASCMKEMPDDECAKLVDPTILLTELLLVRGQWQMARHCVRQLLLLLG